MTVYFVGAGPGSPDLLTVRAVKLLEAAPVIVYAGSLINPEILTLAHPDAKLIDSSGLRLEDLISIFENAHQQCQDVIRLQSGDISLFSAVHEQISRLEPCGIPFEIIPGVPAFSACSAALGQPLTIPNVAQAIVLARAGREASDMPGDSLPENLSSTGATLCLHLAGGQIATISEKLQSIYGTRAPCAWVQRASWPGQVIIRGCLQCIDTKIGSTRSRRQAMLIVGPVLNQMRHLPDDTSRRSAMYRQHRGDNRQ